MSTTTMTVKYFAILRDQTGIGSEQISGSWATLGEVFEELRAKHGIALDATVIRPALGTSYVAWDSAPQDGATLALIPPVSGG